MARRERRVLNLGTRYKVEDLSTHITKTTDDLMEAIQYMSLLRKVFNHKVQMTNTDNGWSMIWPES